MDLSCSSVFRPNSSRSSSWSFFSSGNPPTPIVVMLSLEWNGLRNLPNSLDLKKENSSNSSIRTISPVFMTLDPTDLEHHHHSWQTPFLVTFLMLLMIRPMLSKMNEWFTLLIYSNELTLMGFLSSLLVLSSPCSIFLLIERWSIASSLEMCLTSFLLLPFFRCQLAFSLIDLQDSLSVAKPSPLPAHSPTSFSS